VTSSDNRIDGDVLNVAATAAFGDKNAASGKAVSVSGVTLSGADAGNYTLASSTASTSAAITALELSASFAGVNKTYNGTTAASVTSSDNRIGGDVLKVVATAVFGDKNAASGKAVVVSDVRLSGADAGNYTLASTTGSTTADITARALNLRYSGGDRVYDGTRSASVSLGDDRLDGDILSVAVQASFADKNVGVNKPVSLSGVALGGADAGNYRVVTPAGLLATITPAALSLSAVSASNKVYDGTQTASVSGTLGGVIAQDAVSLTGGSGVFADKNAGAGKVVTASGFRLAGSDAGNYTLSNTGGVTQADIAQRALSTWTGPAGGLWSDAANWENGVAPDASNVLAATAAAGSGSIIYDAAAGDTVLGTINFGRGLNLSGGSLRIGQATTDSASVRDLQISGGKLALTGALAVANYAQTGGALDGSGSLAVSNSFSQSAGSIALGGALAASQASGDLLFASLAAQSISLSAPGGAIAQSGAVVTDSLTTQSQSGATLNNKGNLVASFTASNSGAGGIALTSTTASGQLLLGSLGTGSGNIVIENIGGIETHAINANGGNVSVTAHGPVMVRGVIQGNDVTVTAGADITLEGAAAVRAARALALDANASIALNGTSALEAGAAGSMSLLARTGNISAVSGVRIDSHGAPLTLRAPLGSVQMPSSVFASGTLPVINGVATTTPTSPVVIVAVREAINLINTSLQIPNPTPNGSFSNVEQFGQSVTKSDSNSTTGSKKDDSIKKTYCN
uniref:YDG domain-containing protein n=1 Tax=Massilia sp. S19_KUP03_FR1 TaxID=3025503 RepID=UPI002FCDB4C9